MGIIDDLLASLKEDAPLREVRIGVFWTAVLSRRCGLASTLHQERHHHHGRPPVPEAGSLLEKSALELASYARSESLLEASLGMAAINSLLEVDESICVDLNAREIILQRGAGRTVAVVGHFPFVPEIRKVASQCWVLEKSPGPGDLPATCAPEILPHADVVALTGTSLINRTFDELIALPRPDALVIMLGPTTPLSPVLFDYGVDIISGALVVDEEAALRSISQGATFRQVQGVRLLSMRREK
ncbi:MAG: Rossmann-like domain-containing protein [Anaerolineae bacterium]